MPATSCRKRLLLSAPLLFKAALSGRDVQHATCASETEAARGYGLSPSLAPARILKHLKHLKYSPTNRLFLLSVSAPCLAPWKLKLNFPVRIESPASLLSDVELTLVYSEGLCTDDGRAQTSSSA